MLGLRCFIMLYNNIEYKNMQAGWAHSFSTTASTLFVFTSIDVANFWPTKNQPVKWRKVHELRRGTPSHSRRTWAGSGIDAFANTPYRTRRSSHKFCATFGEERYHARTGNGARAPHRCTPHDRRRAERPRSRLAPTELIVIFLRPE